MKKTKGNYKVVVDRTEAIKQAIDMANKLDIIVLAGKGHEPYQEINGVKYPYDERIIVKRNYRINKTEERLIKVDFQTKMLLGTFAVTVLLGLIIVPILRKLKE